MPEVAGMSIEERRPVAAAPLRVALAMSLVLHGCFFYWYWLILRADQEGDVRGTRSFEVTLSQASTATPAPREAAPRTERRAPAQPEPEDMDDAVQEEAPPQSETPPAPASLPGAPVLSPAPRRRLDLSLPPGLITPAEPSSRGEGVFDPAFRERIRAAQASAPESPAEADVQTWSVSGGARTRVETERGCFERVDDPFADQPGEQWWMVACSPGDRIDWGARFRARP